MSDEILDAYDDFEDQFEQGTKVVVAKYFYFESQARIYAARLKEAGIKSFISNANTISVMPLGEGGIGLHVKEDDLQEAILIIKKMDILSSKESVDQSFHDADQEDISYERDIQQQQSRKLEPVVVILMVVIVLILLNAILRSMGFY